jgi:2-hydroxychromene-2-carboxylate isomerase
MRVPITERDSRGSGHPRQATSFSLVVVLGILVRMERALEIAFDVVCPYAYLASTQIEALSARTKASLRWEPILLGGVFRAIGQSDDPNATMSDAKRRHVDTDLRRWAAHFEVPLVRRADHPRRSVLAMRALCATPESDRVRAIHALFAAYHARGEDIADPSVVRAALTSAGLDGDTLVRATDEPSIKDDLRARTDRAVARGVFGVPAMFVGGELFWGQDRLDFVEQALTH